MRDRECSLPCHYNNGVYSMKVYSGKYDYEFMDYTIRVLRKCHEYGFKIYMDPHQDVVRAS